MRLLVSAAILLVAVLDFQFGRSPAGLQVAALAAGLLLAVTVVIDHLWLELPHPPGRLSPDRANG